MNKNILIKHIVERLSAAEIDYPEKMGARKEAGGDKRQIEAGVLIPLLFETNRSANSNEPVFILSKRSTAVSQPGDLSGPGGEVKPFLDHFLRSLIVHGFPPLLGGAALVHARKRGKAAFDSIALFLANAVRESWEEIRLNPFNIRFLGPLPPYRLRLLAKTIFPMVGLIEKKWEFNSSREVEKLVEIPLKAFYNKENYSFFSIRLQDDMTDGAACGWKSPCLIYENTTGDVEILWGATFNIIMSFLDIVFDFTPPDIHPEKIITKTLHPDYLTGNNRRRPKFLDKFRQDR